jgi:hypothetical protein
VYAIVARTEYTKSRKERIQTSGFPYRICTTSAIVTEKVKMKKQRRIIRNPDS